jgi:two-component system sensor histidine kinase YesM
VDEGSTKIFELTTALGLFFRFSIKGPDMVSLERELTIIKNYIYIHQIRFGDRLKVEYCFDAESLGCMIPQMILQPIVENAIYHGIEPLKRNGLLEIKGYSDEENLYLTVQDNGMGISSDRLEGIHKTLAIHSGKMVQDHHPESGIGLMNVHDRIRIKYGEQYGIQITSKLHGGTQILIKLPVRSEWDEL